MTEPDPTPARPTSHEGLRILAFAGSLRSGSFNRALLRAAVELAPDDARIDPYALDGIPLYDRDLEREGDPDAVRRFKQAIDDADAVLIATPEYQNSIPGVLKNALDWASRPHGESVLKRKPAGILGATPGRFGTARAQDDLRKILRYNEAFVLPRPTLLVRNARDKFDDEPELTDEATRTRLARLLRHLVAWARHMEGWKPPSD